jgi:hypothetical protein
MTTNGGLYQGCISLDGVNDGKLIVYGSLTWKCGETMVHHPDSKGGT